jgi:hypothetical protein
MIKATRNGIKGIFSDTDWKSGLPQRYGWQEQGKEGKTLPKEIIQFIERRKEAPKVEIKPHDKPFKKIGIDVADAIEADVKKEIVKMKEVLKDEPIVPIVKTTKTKKNDNKKQSGRTPRKSKS